MNEFIIFYFKDQFTFTLLLAYFYMLMCFLVLLSHAHSMLYMGLFRCTASLVVLMRLPIILPNKTFTYNSLTAERFVWLFHTTQDGTSLQTQRCNWTNSVSQQSLTNHVTHTVNACDPLPVQCLCSAFNCVTQDFTSSMLGLSDKTKIIIVIKTVLCNY